MTYIPRIRESAEVHWWQDGADHVETFNDTWQAQVKFSGLMDTRGAYNIKLVKCVTTSEVLDEVYVRNVKLIR